MQKELILASVSPRRVQLLELIGYPFRTCPSGLEEEEITGPISTGVEKLAGEKARYVAERFPRALVLGADTVVELNEEIMGKPSGRAEAKEMLLKLSGSKHRVYTGLALVSASQNGEFCCDHAVTEVIFRTLGEKEIENYLKYEDWLDKAGAYAIQGRAGVFVESLHGCYFNVVGLPVSKTYTMLISRGLSPSSFWG